VAAERDRDQLLSHFRYARFLFAMVWITNLCGTPLTLPMLAPIIVGLGTNGWRERKVKKADNFNPLAA